MLTRKFLKPSVLGLSAFFGLVAWPTVADPGTDKLANIIRGTLNGYELKDKDDRIDGAMVLSALDARALISFQLGDLLGPDEPLKAGPISKDVPGNLHFPKQKERYGIFPVTIEKSSFGLPFERGTQGELFAMYFQAPFNEAADKARAKAPYRELLKLISFKAFGLTDNRDWSQQGGINIALDRSHETGQAFTWNRAAPSAKEWDGLVGFQKTPHNRWVVSDFRVAPPAQGEVRRISGLNTEHRAIFFRVLDTDDNKKPRALAGRFTHSASGPLTLDGVAPYLAGVRLENARSLRWDALADHGWVAVLRGKSSKIKAHEEDPFSVFGDFGFASLFQFAKPLVAWVAPSAGVYELESPLAADETLTILFIKTAVEVPTPTDDEVGDPPLLIHAQEMRMQIVQ